MITVYFVRNGSKIPVEVDTGAHLWRFILVDIPEIPADCGPCVVLLVMCMLTKRLHKHGKTRDNTPEIELLEYEKGFKDGEMLAVK